MEVKDSVNIGQQQKLEKNSFQAILVGLGQGESGVSGDKKSKSSSL